MAEQVGSVEKAMEVMLEYLGFIENSMFYLATSQEPAVPTRNSRKSKSII